MELLDYIKSDVDIKGLDYVFPEVKNIFYLDHNGDSNFIYTRQNNDSFLVAKTMSRRDDDELEISDDDMLATVKQSQGDYEIRIQKTKDGYDITLVEKE
jgi:hypothetical protein